jgi:hypothetical protein
MQFRAGANGQVSRDIDRFKLAFINQRHITEANLNNAITLVVNAYAQFPLQRLWDQASRHRPTE